MLLRRGVLLTVGGMLSLSGCTDVLQRDKEERTDILRKYSNGVENANDGSEARKRGVESLNAEHYIEAEQHFKDAQNFFNRASDDFDDASNQAVEIDHSEARDICDTAREYAVLLEETSTFETRAARNLQEGNYDVGNDNIDKAQQRLSEARRLNVRDPSTLRSVLNLD